MADGLFFIIQKAWQQFFIVDVIATLFAALKGALFGKNASFLISCNS